jgi:glycosyltransferase involved in cell wall biosynthesis
MSTPSITAIVIFRNEQQDLARCLAALRWCDELIAVNMDSVDGSLDIARRFADRVFHVRPYPIAEPTRVAAAKLARNDWILLVDPDELIPPNLADDLRRTLQAHPNAGAISLPMWFYFKGRRLTGTVWGTLTYKQRLIHRQRCKLLPLCNRLTELVDRYEDIRIDHTGENHMHHYWSNSYLDLFKRHLRRYAHLEAAAMVAQGERFSFRRAIRFPLYELKRTLKDFDGWRLGFRGLTLSTIYFLYVILSCWLMPYYQWRKTTSCEHDAVHALPDLCEDRLDSASQRFAA